MSVAQSGGVHTFPCPQCGADVSYQPGVGLSCAYCGYVRPEAEEGTVRGWDLAPFLKWKKRGYGTAAGRSYRCESCGALTTVDGEVMALVCPFCGAPVVLEPDGEEVLRPEGVVPFEVPREKVAELFREWLASLPFAPSAVRAASSADVQGVYRPFWLFSAATRGWYSGERGEEVLRGVCTWSPASGRVSELFKDVRVEAGRPLSWRTSYYVQKLKPYDPAYLSGWQAERYRLGLDEAWEIAQKKMQQRLEEIAKDDIGGSHVRLHRLLASYDAVDFKHILLPVYLATYRHGGRSYRFQVNGQTGEVDGERPWSFWKILVAVLLAAAGLLFLLSRS